MKRTPLLIALLAVGFSSVQAAPSSYSPIGPNIGYGDSSNPNSVFSKLVNPANNAFNVIDEDSFRFGIAASAQIQVELTGLEGSKNFFDNRIEPLLDANTITGAVQLQTQINNYFERYQQGNFSVIGGVTIPLIVKTDVLGGGISFDYTRQLAASGTFLRNAPIPLPTIDVATGNLTILPGAVGLQLGYKRLDEFALGYGRNIISNESGAFSAGITARHLSLLSNTHTIDFATIVDDNIGGATRTANDYLDDMNRGTSDSNITADIGVNWTAENYMLGFTAMNLTEPSFRINDLSTIAASTAFDRFTQSEFTLKPQYRVSGQFFTDNRHWTLAGSIDLVEANDLNNRDTQWWTASAAYATNSAWYIPDIRFGLRSNMAGTQLTYTNVGLTLGFLNLDLATTTMNPSDVTDHQKDVGVMGSAGVEFDF